MSSPDPEGGVEPFAGPVPALSQPPQSDNCIKVLLATDNHIGYAEKDPVRGQDSINAFREILQLAVANDVDLLLLAGDLFHENRPSRTSTYQTIAALREFTQSSRPIEIQLVNDAGIGIRPDVPWPNVNYEDENINVGLPVFSIHGNHDDPQGTGSEGALCALDILAASGLINYFGKMELPSEWNEDDTTTQTGLEVKPVLLQKGDTKLALYGMGNIRDERFHAQMRARQIQLFKPAENPEEWFNIILVHQNRVPHGPNNFTSDNAFGEEADLVVWGHEHDCIDKARPQPVTGRRYYISQPGSSIATSLAAGEAIPKHVALIKIQGKEFEFEPIRLRSVRPFIFEDVSLMEEQAKGAVLKTKVQVNKFLKARVNQLIDRANAEWAELHPDEDDEDREPMLPLIRLRVDYSGGPDELRGFEVGNPQRFGQDFTTTVANPRDIVSFHRKSAAARKSKVTMDMPNLDGMDLDGEDESGRQGKIKIGDLVNKYLEAQELKMLPEKFMQNAVEDFVDKGDKGALMKMVKDLLKSGRKAMDALDFTPSKEGFEYDDLENEINQVKEAAGKGAAKSKARRNDSDDEDQPKAKGKKTTRKQQSESDSMDDSDDLSDPPPTTKGKKAPAKTPAKKPTQKKAQPLFDDDDDDESESELEVEEAPKKKAPARKTKAASPAATRKKAPAKKSKAVDLTTSEDDSEEEEAPSRKRKR